MMNWLRSIFTGTGPVRRQAYVVSGLALATIKYAVDLALVWSATGRFWSPLNYILPLDLRAGAPTWLLPAMALWTLPFLWIGVTMSERRAVDAGLSPWTSLLFFVPGLNWVYLAIMSIVPSRVAPATASKHGAGDSDATGMLPAIAGGVVIGFAMMLLGGLALKTYGAGLFLGTPFIACGVGAFILNQRRVASRQRTMGVMLITLLIIGIVAIATAQEGAICLIMAAPLALPFGAFGASFGRRIAMREKGSPQSAWVAIVVLPMLVVADINHAPTPLREVRTSIEIDADPMRVWSAVVAFPALPEPTDLVFRSGIAYPRRATIRGEGVGAVRYCLFSTGAFIEPITTWEPGRRLSFNVVSSPPPMREWSPYAGLRPAHLDGYFASRRGEFRLIALVDGRTRLEGSTWYEMRIHPGAYWSLIGDALVHRIHERVLEHIKLIAEAKAH